MHPEYVLRAFLFFLDLPASPTSSLFVEPLRIHEAWGNSRELPLTVHFKGYFASAADISACLSF